MTDWTRLLAFAVGRAATPLALASLVGRRGSSYLAPGARLLVADDGTHAGALSGGCLEDDIARAARAMLRAGRPEELHIDTRPHFGCAGTLHIYLEPLPAGLLDAIARARAARRPFALRTRLGPAGGTSSEPAPAALPQVSDPAAAAGEFLQIVPLTPRLLIAGDAPDARAVADFATRLGWETCFLPRELPAAEALAPFAPDARTALLALTHHLARDLALLRAALPAGYGYLGLLGSRRRRESILATLGEEGLLADEAALGRLHAPVGLDLGGDSPEAIALAVVAELQAVWAGRSAGFLRDKFAPLHTAAPRAGWPAIPPASARPDHVAGAVMVNPLPLGHLPPQS